MAIKDEIKDVQEAVINQFITDNGITNTLADGQVTTNKIADGAVTSIKLGNNVSLGGGSLTQGSVTSTQLADNAVTGDKITDGAVTPTKLSSGGPSWTSSGVLHVESNDSSGSANLKLSSFTPSVIFEDKTSNAKDFQIKADSNLLKILSGNTNGDSQLADEIITIYADGTATFGRSSESSSSPESGIVLNDAGVVITARDGTGASTHHSFYNNASVSPTNVGRIYTAGSSTNYATSSDHRLKEDIVDMEGSIERLKDLKPVNFKWKSDGTRVDGFIAHEAQEVVPESVSGIKDDVDDNGNPEYQGIDQSKLVPLLTKALQESLTQIEALEARVTALENT